MRLDAWVRNELDVAHDARPLRLFQAGYDGDHFEVRGHEAALSGLTAEVVPYFDERAEIEGSTAGRVIALVAPAELFDDLSTLGESAAGLTPLSLGGGYGVYQRVSGSPYQAVIFRRDMSIVGVFPEGAASPPQLALARLLRCAAVARARHAGFCLLHASAVVMDDRAFLFSGPKRSGKTTLMLRALERGWDLMSNDEVLVGAEGPTALGLPMTAGVRMSTLRLFPQLAKFAGRPARDIHRPNDVEGEPSKRKVSLRLAELCRAFERPIRPAAKLSALTLLEPGPQGSKTRLTELFGEERSQTLRAQVLYRTSENQPFWDAPAEVAPPVAPSEGWSEGVRCFRLSVDRDDAGHSLEVIRQALGGAR